MRLIIIPFLDEWQAQMEMMSVKFLSFMKIYTFPTLQVFIEYLVKFIPVTNMGVVLSA